MQLVALKSGYDFLLNLTPLHFRSIELPMLEHYPKNLISNDFARRKFSIESMVEELQPILVEQNEFLEEAVLIFKTSGSFGLSSITRHEQMHEMILA